MRMKLLALLSGLALAAVPAWAGSVTFNFATLAPSPGSPTPQNTDLGNPVISFLGSDGTTVLLAQAEACSPTCVAYAEGTGTLAVSPDLYYKVTSGDPSETGLGLTGTVDNEVGVTGSIDFSPVLAPPYGELTIIGSLQSGEDFDVFGCGGGSCTLLTSGGATSNDMASVTISNASNYGDIFVTATSGNLLIDSVTVTTPVPEPSALLLLGTALLALAGYGFRRRRLADMGR